MGVSDFGRGGRVLNYSGRERFRASRACFEIVGASYFGRGECVLPTMIYELLAHVISAEEKARLGEVTNLHSMYNGPIDACPT